MTILVVDDEPAVRESLRRALELEGYEVELAADGEEAVARLEQNGQPDAVILDILMPGMDGLEVCRRLRAARNQVPVLMLTARAEVDSRVAGLDAGADDYLPKPFALAELLARLRALLRRAAGDSTEKLAWRIGSLTSARATARAPVIRSSSPGPSSRCSSSSSATRGRC
jgi:two-component system response regulator MprA